MRLGPTCRGRTAVRDRTRALALLAIGCALSALDTACGSNSEATTQGEDDGGVSMASPGIVLSRRSNALALQNHSTQCSFCTCHPLVPASTKCVAALLDSFPPAKRMVVCEIAAAEQMEACLSLAQTCADAQECEATEQAETAKCPTVDPLQLPPPPSGC
jgi:hypothetical protein